MHYNWRILLIVVALIVPLVCCCADDSSNDTAQAEDDDDTETPVDDDTGDDDAIDDDVIELGARTVLSLNDIWQVEEGGSQGQPTTFTRTVVVPALLNAAQPPFERVGKKSWGDRAFWYRTTFEAPASRESAILNIHKAKYGVKAWLNGQEIGEHLGSYTLASFDVGQAIVWGEENELIVRVGDYVDAVPRSVPAAQDLEKDYFLPGIYDDVELVLADAPRIVRTKIEPDIDDGTVRVLTTVENDASAAVNITIRSQAVAWADGTRAGEAVATSASIPADEEVVVEQIVTIDDPILWWPENPFLYAMRTVVERDGAATDDLQTRFGMRQVEWCSGEGKGFYLNDRRTYLRGSNITLHRFFEDESAGTLAWNRDWVRQLLTDAPRQLHWNCFRISLGRAPNFWYDLADESGVLLADEFQFWSIADGNDLWWSVDEMETEYRSWIQENWNHPSIAWWDGANETRSKKVNQVIQRVRDLDPTRQWENGGWNEPTGPDDPVEDHPYFFDNDPFTRFELTEIDDNDGHAPQAGTWEDPARPYILNEYGWLWINRDGTPTGLTERAYRELLGWGFFTPDEYREAYAYVVGGLTEFWRANRAFESVQHFTYLGYSRPGGATSDNFIDVENLVLEPHWLEYARHAFSPLGIYLDSWREDYPAGEAVAIPLQLINDERQSQTVTAIVAAVNEAGDILSQSPGQVLTLEANGSAACEETLTMPSAERYMLFACLLPADPARESVVSRRKVGFAHVGLPGPESPCDRLTSRRIR